MKADDLPLLMWVPMDRCIPEQRMQTKIPRFQEAQRGSIPKSGGWFSVMKAPPQSVIYHAIHGYLFFCNQHSIYFQVVVTILSKWQYSCHSELYQPFGHGGWTFAANKKRWKAKEKQVYWIEGFLSLNFLDRRGLKADGAGEGGLQSPKPFLFLLSTFPLMPTCVECGTSVQDLYTKYSKDNIRLTSCVSRKETLTSNVMLTHEPRTHVINSLTSISNMTLSLFLSTCCSWNHKSIGTFYSIGYLKPAVALR